MTIQPKNTQAVISRSDNLPPVTIFWFRRDLRLEDNTGLGKALAAGHPVVPIFIFDPNILDGLPRDDARVTFIFDTLQTLKSQLRQPHGSNLALYHGQPAAVFEQLVHSYSIAAVYANHDYEPYARQRDAQIRTLLGRHRIKFLSFKDHVLFETSEIVKPDNQPYVVYTPYMRRWKTVWREKKSCAETTSPNWGNLLKHIDLPSLSLADIGFKRSAIRVPAARTGHAWLHDYRDTRDFPACEGTSRLGPHLRFGTVGIRKIFHESEQAGAEAFCNELIWREFFSQILWHFPHTPESCFKPRFEHIAWRNDESEFKYWCQGMTGYPLVDAGMRQLNQTGFMHNRVRMVTASFLCKHLLIDWRWGEAYFAEKLLDYEMASNVGNWQWVAGCGVDAAPYFRIFNPMTQADKFDRDKRYIGAWIKDLNAPSYPQPIVEHAWARKRCLDAYRRALGAS
ncbi:cryptochrome/photolyase family protein [Nitrosomonas halophila]|uniref:Deoxyribodipyrimidine photo-lyase n=1 Tax=Nitrosomonas halophila TaxID=44576 RepID=A0A1H3EEN4_9PROT|nr:deoxyribodipyrimidine photo-lyase [Nitrosomonas halophila]SDX77095.1 deoxyribodipyrimidine photo-lyase [Nitrosomonas halophila]